MVLTSTKHLPDDSFHLMTHKAKEGYILAREFIILELDILCLCTCRKNGKEVSS
uniref:Uncharacterized protein n=1 Tax=Rhizophora mucronata TaxID=61149 RepID=A0A2P2R3A9_RHIMU